MQRLRSERIWELDCARGIALIGMIVIHFIYDLVDLYGVLNIRLPDWYLTFKNNYGLLFLLISGISVTLGRQSLRRGLTVFCCGFLCTAVTFGMYLIGMAGQDIIIYYGVLQCLGTCMMLWPCFRRLPGLAAAVLGIAMIAAGLWLRYRSFDVPWLLIPLGFTPGWFASSDYFPLLPNLGYFLLGSALGRMLYADKTTRFPYVNPNAQPLRCFCTMGRNSLLIYLLHQPVLAGVTMVIALVCGK